MTTLTVKCLSPSVELRLDYYRSKETLSEGVFAYKWSWSNNPEVYQSGDLNYFHFENLRILSNGHLQLHCDDIGHPFENSQLNQDYVLKIYSDKKAEHKLRTDTDLVIVEEECIVLAGWSPGEWGHFILDFFPRILMLREIFRDGVDYPIYVSSLTPDYLVEVICMCLRLKKSIIKTYRDSGYTVFRKAIVPGHAFGAKGGGFHPEIGRFVRDFTTQIKHNLNFPSTLYSQKIYVSRKHDSVYKPLNPLRPVVNEDEVINFVLQRNFTVVRMEDFSFLEKICLLGNVSLILGGWGSGLLNSFLGVSGSRVLSLGLGFNSSQQRITRLLQQDYHEIPTFDPCSPNVVLNDIRARPQKVNLNFLSAFLDKMDGFKS